VAESANEVSQTALVSVDGREAADEVAKRHAGGGHADGAG
jgi:hypothetical protein